MDTKQIQQAMVETKIRCQWARSHELFVPYHDEEWGVPVHDDRLLFEMLNLEGAQAGLSWLTILKKRENYRAAFDYFDAGKIANYDTAKKESLLQNEGIVRNRLKINAVVENAKAVLEVKREFGSFDRYIWQFVGGKPLGEAEKQQGVAISERMSKDLKKRGFRFVGATICYAFMQAVGMVDDHAPDCFRAGMIAG
ncbi:DNA-3-methyladenine glycosylase I [Dictyobacter kobayashii]|uniref:DNA-3-methyladenine glycosylase I n=1 Tax=Dictyobacter kobayashii TaxID=2014872 RepID=A0A402ARW4_9CHLR|nr:DNA-3-methyladenine glycosylase I [Dictyobacter kobayashii]GCE21836.1 DNA-3-methyladenine glycosylase I [Dictyobacter kobayashii]